MLFSTGTGAPPLASPRPGTAARSEGGGSRSATIRRFAGAVLALLVATAIVRPDPARAHGEHNLEPFFRLRGVTFLDVRFSTDRLAVNEPLEIAGKFRFMESWPRTVPMPELAYLNVLVPGPRLAVTERWLNGRFVQNAFHIEPGTLYDFRVRLRAREPGEWHVHGLVNLEGTGSLVAPGKTITVENGATASWPFTIPATGEKVDLETFGLARVVGWHAVFFAIAIAWILFWVVRPISVRYVLNLAKREDELISPRDRKVAGGFAAVLVVVVAGGLWTTASNAPPTIPHQVQDEWNLPVLPHPHDVELGEPQYHYSPMTRTMTLKVEATNRGQSPVRLHRFATSYLTFLADDALEDWPLGDGESPVLQVSPRGPILPGETRALTLVMQDSIWETDSFINYQQPQVTAAGLLIFIDAAPPAPGAERPIVMTTNDRQAPGVPWDRVRSVNEAYSTLKVDFGPGMS